MKNKSNMFCFRSSSIIVMLLVMYGLMFGAVANAATSTTLTISDVADLTPDYVRPGAQKVPMLALTLTDTLAEDFTKAKIRYSGTDKADIAAVHLYAESSGNGGSFDPVTDILLGTSSSTTTTVFTINLGPAFAFRPNVPQQFYFVVDIADTAVNGNVVDLRIYKSDLTIGGNDWPDVGINPAGSSTIQSLPADSTPPVINSVTGNTSGTTGEVTTITVVATDNVDVVSAKIFIDGDTTGSIMAESPDNTFTFDVPVPSDSTENIAYQVTIYDQAGNSAASNTYTITVTDNDDPVAEAGPDQTVDEDTIVNFDASGSSDNIGIVSYQWNFGDGVGTASGASPTYIYPEPGTYTVTLTVADAADNTSLDSLVVTVLDITPPVVPTSLDATYSDGTVSLSWQASSDNSGSVAGYNIYRSTSSGGPYEKLNSSLLVATNYLDAGVIVGSTYHYVVTAIDAAGNESGYSNEAVVSATDSEPPPENELDEIQGLLADLKAQIQDSVGTPKGIRTSLVSKLSAAESKLSQAEERSGIQRAELLKAASNILRAFQNALRAQGGSGKIGREDYDSWSTQAEAIRHGLQEIIGS